MLTQVTSNLVLSKNVHFQNMLQENRSRERAHSFFFFLSSSSFEVAVLQSSSLKKLLKTLHTLISCSCRSLATPNHFQPQILERGCKETSYSGVGVNSCSIKRKLAQGTCWHFRPCAEKSTDNQNQPQPLFCLVSIHGFKIFRKNSKDHKGSSK